MSDEPLALLGVSPTKANLSVCSATQYHLSTAVLSDEFPALRD